MMWTSAALPSRCHGVIVLAHHEYDLWDGQSASVGNPVASASAAAFLLGPGSMNYQAVTNDSLTMMYEAVRGALAVDDASKRQGAETRFRVRETPDWKKHAADLEQEMLTRGMFFDVIDWTEDQATLPFEG
jgi:hypothetical protein